MSLPLSSPRASHDPGLQLIVDSIRADSPRAFAEAFEAALLAEEARRVRSLPPNPTEQRRIRPEVRACHLLSRPLSTTRQTVDEVRYQVSAHERGEITGDAMLAGIAHALCLHPAFSEPVGRAAELDGRT